MVHAICTVNFAFDKSQKPHVTSPLIAEHFGVSLNTASQKSKTLRDLFRMRHWDEEFSTQEMQKRSPMRMLWIAVGQDDFLRKRNEDFVAVLKAKGITHTWKLTEGAHAWPVWRGNLADFAPLLFTAKCLQRSDRPAHPPTPACALPVPGATGGKGGETQSAA